ncbi:MAG TPA: hypothetical protein VGM58_01180 [Verrucomicrobiae bacterium]
MSVFEFVLAHGYILNMKCVGKVMICLAGGLALNASLSAAEAVSPNNPYVPIVTRNVFGLNPPQPVDTTANTEPPPKITPNGIMTIFGNRQVLFKVSIPAKPGIPAKEDDYILGEGQRQDDIEVTRIDEKSGVVTFNNHGTVQEIPLTVAPTIAMTGAVNQNPSPAMPYAEGGRRFGGGGRFGRNFAIGNNGNNSNGGNNGGNFNGANNGSNLRSVPTRQEVPQIDPDQQIIMIEAQRELHKGDPDYPPLPITELTPDDAAGPGGNPLAAPSP